MNERDRGAHNYPDDVSADEMLTCLAQVGVSGCTREAPLEAAKRALQRAMDAEDPAYGFLRDDAGLVVVLMGDEDDCSVRPEHAGIFDGAGERTFWSESTREATSAICWNAAVACDGGPGLYDGCHSVERASNGAPASAQDSVFPPVTEYIEFFRRIERHKQQLAGDRSQRVFVSAVSGVPAGYPDLDVVYQDSLDPATQTAFGIGAGCSSTGSTAMPPVRTREVAEAFAAWDVDIASACAPDWTPALACLPGLWPPQIDPGCVTACVADANPETSELEHECFVTEELDGERRVLPDCDLVCGDAPCANGEQGAANDWAFPADAPACVLWLQGDAVGGGCREDGWNLEYRVMRRENLWQGWCHEVTCRASTQPEVDCPGL